MRDRNAKRHDQCYGDRGRRAPANHNFRLTQVTPEGNYMRNLPKLDLRTRPKRINVAGYTTKSRVVVFNFRLAENKRSMFQVRASPSSPESSILLSSETDFAGR